MMQAEWRRFSAVRRYREALARRRLWAALTIQRYVRRYLAQLRGRRLALDKYLAERERRARQLQAVIRGTVSPAPT
jgi:hypothetical protein